MNYGLKTNTGSDLTSMAQRAGAKITDAIQSASAKTGVGFNYLLQQANVESSFKTDAKAKGSSATGLYQFIDSTWLSMVKENGEKYGLGKYADKISDNGTVASRSVKKQILALRKDPAIASAMAAEYAADNKQYLQSTVGGDIGSTELYMAHFMGPGGAAKFLSKMQDNPDAISTKSFSKEACSNPAVFYKENGKPRTLSEVYAFFDKKFQDDGTTPIQSTATQYADANTLSAGARAALMSASFTSGRANIFDEATGSWFSTSNPKDVQLSKMMANNTGSIAGLQGAVSNPVDIMQIMELASLHNDPNRYNS